jgi:hypothetical protein
LGLGALAAFARSDLTILEAAGKAMAIYLMLAKPSDREGDSWIGSFGSAWHL